MAELTTAKGVPYVDAADLLTAYPGRMQDLAAWVDARPGVAIVTTAQRGALAAPDLWVGKLVYNTDTGRLERCTSLGPPAVWAGITQLTPMTDAQRDALGGNDLWAGRAIYNTTANAVQVYDGAAWRQGSDTVAQVTDAQRDALAGDELWTGRIVWNTTSLTLQMYDGAAWRQSDTLPIFTTAARTALAGDDLWAGRIVWDSTVLSVYVYDGAAWRQGVPATPLDTVAGDITAVTRGAAGAAGGIGKGADAGHGHPWADTDTTIDSRHSATFRIDQRQLVLTYTSGNLTQVVEKDSTGATTVRTINLTYTSGNLTQVQEISNGHTATTTLAYTSGNLTGVTRSYV